MRCFMVELRETEIDALIKRGLLDRETALVEAAPAATQAHSVKHRSTLAGTWSGRYSGAFSGTFTLHWTQSGTRLSGTITLSSPKGKYGINGSVHGTAEWVWGYDPLGEWDKAPLVPQAYAA